MIDDRDLARRFQDARREDEERAPSLSQLWARPADLGRRRAASVPQRLAPALVVLAFLALALAFEALRSPAPTVAPPTPEAKAFSSQPRWVAPTDFLLEPPSPELWRSTPSIGRSLPTLEPGAAAPTKGTGT